MCVGMHVNMCVSVRNTVCMHGWMCARMCSCCGGVRMFVYVCVCVYVSPYVCVWVCVCVCVCDSVSVWMCVCMCMYV